MKKILHMNICKIEKNSIYTYGVTFENYLSRV